MAEKENNLPAGTRHHLEQAYAHDAAGEFEQALRECEAALELDPSLPEAHNVRGVLLEELDRKQEALAAYRQALQLDPDFQDAQLNLSELESELVEPHVQRAYDLLVADKPGRALRECEAALELAPTHAPAHNLRGIALEELGRIPEAVEAYQQAIRLEPDFEDAKLNLSELQARLDESSIGLEAELPEPYRLVTIAAFSFPMEARIAKTKLDAVEIWSFLADEHTITMNWLYSHALHGVKLQIMPSDIARARELLSHDAESMEWAEDESEEEDEPLRCPHCQSTYVYYKRYNLRLVYLSWLILRFPLPFLQRRYQCADCGFAWKPQDPERL